MVLFKEARKYFANEYDPDNIITDTHVIILQAMIPRRNSSKAETLG